MSDRDARLAALALPQSGLVTTGQATAAGLTRYAVEAAVSSGTVERRHRGLLTVPTVTAEDVWRIRVQEALLRAGRDAVAGAETAARLLSIAGSPPIAPITVIVPLGRHPVRQPGVRLLRSDVAEGDRTHADGLPATTPVRTVVDCARRSDQVVAVCLLESAMRQELTTAEEVETRLDDFRPRARGVARARAALTRVDLRSESPLETVTRLLLLDHGFPCPEPQLPFVAGDVAGRIDLAYPVELLGLPDRHYRGLAIETDGREPHLRAERFHHDRVRQTALEEERWLVRRFTDPHVRRRPAYVVATVQRAFERIASAS